MGTPEEPSTRAVHSEAPTGSDTDDVHTTFLVPVFNGERYLREALTSIQVQSTRGWTGFIVDDGSTDQSWEIIQDFISSHPTSDWQAWRHPTNRGLYPRLREVMPRLRTPWVAIVMQDDSILPDYLSEMRRVRASYPEAEAIWATYLTVDADGEVLGRGVQSGRIEVIPPGRAPWVSALRRGCFWIISGSYTRTRCFRETPFREDLPHTGDYEWLLRALRRYEFVYLESALARIRVHAGAASARHLAAGIDFQEQRRVLAENFTPPAPPIPWATQAAVGAKFAWLALLRAGGAARRHEWRMVGVFALYAGRFALLGLTLRWRRAPGAPGGGGPAR